MTFRVRNWHLCMFLQPKKAKIRKMGTYIYVWETMFARSLWVEYNMSGGNWEVKMALHNSESTFSTLFHCLYVGNCEISLGKNRKKLSAKNRNFVKMLQRSRNAWPNVSVAREWFPSKLSEFVVHCNAKLRYVVMNYKLLPCAKMAQTPLFECKWCAHHLVVSAAWEN